MSFEIKLEYQKFLISLFYIVTLMVVAYIDAKSSTKISFLLLYVLVVLLAANSIGGVIAYAIAFLSATMRVWIQIEESPMFDPIAALWAWASLTTVNSIMVYLLTKKNSLLCELEKTSLTDHLTDMPNRRAFRQRLQSAIAKSRRSRTSFCLSYIDIDNFKTVNDLLGHDEGDQLLILVGKVITSHLRAEDTAARLGGDEFALIFEGSTDLIYRIKEELDSAVKEQCYNVSFSIGVVCYDGGHKIECDGLIKFADSMMYRVKKTSKNGVFESDLPFPTDSFYE